MRISKVKLDNFSCFYDAPEFELGPGINFIIGKNNSGKTALIEALSHEGNGVPHRTEATLSVRDPVVQPENITSYAIEHEFSSIELRTTLRKHGELFYFPASAWGNSNLYEDYVRRDILTLLNSDLNLKFSYKNNHLKQVNVMVGTIDLIFDNDVQSGKLLQAITMPIDDSLQPMLQEWQLRNVSPKVTIWAIIEDLIPTNIYRFHAERPVSRKASANYESRLQPDASNLAQVVHSLQTLERSMFEEYLCLVKRAFPSVHEIVTITEDGDVEVRLEFVEPSSRRRDLAIPLSECGTGIGQIMAMLYVVVAYEESRIIIIDEPHSFLHPGAIRELLKIFEEYPRHQYILTTHSPTAIMSVQKKRILLVTRKNNISNVKSVDVGDNTRLEEALEEIGSKRSDIFGMDTVIWVEGKTDKICFNLVMDKHGGLPAGVEIVDLVHTGDFSDKKRGNIIEQIYARLSGSVGILPSVLAFVFDGDLQNSAFRETETRKFLPRQNYESYLIVPDILADILNHDAAEDKPKDHTADSVKQWIRDKQGKEYDDPEWLNSVDGAKLLNTMFQELAGISYKGNKAQYGEKITRRILANDPNHFQEIVDLIKSILPDATS